MFLNQSMIRGHPTRNLTQFFKESKSSVYQINRKPLVTQVWTVSTACLTDKTLTIILHGQCFISINCPSIGSIQSWLEITKQLRWKKRKQRLSGLRSVNKKKKKRDRWLDFKEEKTFRLTKSSHSSSSRHFLTISSGAWIPSLRRTLFIWD